MPGFCSFALWHSITLAGAIEVGGIRFIILFATAAVGLPNIAIAAEDLPMSGTMYFAEVPCAGGVAAMGRTFNFQITGEAAETRCGWVINPTPGNWSLIDADQEWILASRGGIDTPGMDNMVDFTEGDGVVTDGASYGNGCACLRVEVSDGTITKIMSVRQLRRRNCKDDQKLPAIME